MQLARDTRATTAVEAAPKAFGAAMFKILQATSLRMASAWQARLPLQTNRAGYLVGSQNYDTKIAQMRPDFQGKPGEERSFVLLRQEPNRTTPRYQLRKLSRVTID